MEKFLEQLKEDVRYIEGLKACLSCGTCTAVCPAAAFSAYDPRSIVEKVQSKNEELLVELLSGEDIWWCGECMSCRMRCPRGNTPGYLIQALRALSVKSGLFSQSVQGRLQKRIIQGVGKHILQYGYCVHVDEIDNEDFPEQGPVWEWFRLHKKEVLERLGANYKKEGAGTLRKISEQSLHELRAIFHETGALDQFDKIEKAVLAEEKKED
jgi:heterodisulfide reductase subunit C1